MVIHPVTVPSLLGRARVGPSYRNLPAAALAKKGIRLIGLTVIPNMKSDMPFATGERGYCMNDNGCHRVWTFKQELS